MQTEISNLAHSSILFLNSNLKVAMGVNRGSDCRVSAGGPYDDDSIIAYKLTGEKFKRYNLRTVDSVYDQLDHLLQNEFKKLSQLYYPNGRVFQDRIFNADVAKFSSYFPYSIFCRILSDAVIFLITFLNYS